MGEVDEIFDYIVQYEEENNLQDISSPNELEDIDLSPEDIEFLQSEGNKLPPVPEGKEMSPAMLNFARTVTKAYRLYYFQFLHFIENSDAWNCAMQGFTRGDEVRNCRLPDLCHEINYGPWCLSARFDKC